MKKCPLQMRLMRAGKPMTCLKRTHCPAFTHDAVYLLVAEQVTLLDYNFLEGFVYFCISDTILVPHLVLFLVPAWSRFKSSQCKQWKGDVTGNANGNVSENC